MVGRWLMLDKSNLTVNRVWAKARPVTLAFTGTREKASYVAGGQDAGSIEGALWVVDA
jgi:hypothetical protein